MPSFEEEAFNRAQQMHRKPQFNREAPRREVPKQPEKQEEPSDVQKQGTEPNSFACDTAYGGKHRSVSSACADVSSDVIIGFVRFL